MEVPVGVFVGVFVGVEVAPSVGDGVAVFVGVFEGVEVGVGKPLTTICPPVTLHGAVCVPVRINWHLVIIRLLEPFAKPWKVMSNRGPLPVNGFKTLHVAIVIADARHVPPPVQEALVAQMVPALLPPAHVLLPRFVTGEQPVLNGARVTAVACTAVALS